MAKKSSDLVAHPHSEPMVFHDGGMTPVSEYDGDDAPDPSTVGVIDEPSPAATRPRAVVVKAEDVESTKKKA